MRTRALWFISLFFILTLSCRKKREEQVKLFTLLDPSSTGVGFENRLTETEEFNMIDYLYFNNGGGVAAGDINNDGLADLYFSASQGPNRLYLNRGNMEFEEITEKAGVAGRGDWSTGVTMADVNGDGWLDIYLCQLGDYKGMEGRNQLFINQKDLTFRESAEAYGLAFRGFSTQSAFFDYDLDGDLDMYLLNHSVHTTRSYGGADLRRDSDPRAGDRLYRNMLAENDGQDPAGTPLFTEVTTEAGIYSSPIGYGLGVAVSDLNNDGYPDIYISNDFHENDYLYINRGDGTFSERLRSMVRHTSRSSMGNDVADMNNDGYPDVVVLDMLPDEEKIRQQSGGEDEMEVFRIKLQYGYYHQYVRNTLQLNLGGELFSEIGRLAGIHATDWSWSPLLADLDLDGWRDLFITNGIFRRANDLDYVMFLTGGNRYFPEQDNSGVPDRTLYEKMPLQPDVNYLFRNNRDLTFSDSSAAWASAPPSFSNGSATADMDNDGDPDLVVNNINAPAFIYRNNAETLLSHHYLKVRLEGEGWNRSGTGARVTVYRKGMQQTAEQFSTRGFFSSSSRQILFGLGTDPGIDSLTVQWPGGQKQILRQVEADRELTLRQKDAAHVVPPVATGSPGRSPATPAPLFVADFLPGLAFTHLEDDYRDTDREQLIPHNLSMEGPALAVADVNMDGLDDLFAGGAAGQPAALFLQQPDGSFREQSPELFHNDRYTEDVDALFFDADGDGDPDLYVVRGGNEAREGNPLLADRLMINDGKGRFTRSEPGAIPYMARNGSCVRAADLDMDGDPDLFVGARSVPGIYGLTPASTLLINDGKGRFHEAAGISEKLTGAGMVTDAVWADLDGDGDPDLAVVGEWMNISLFMNDNGTLKPAGKEAGLENTTGWWNVVEAADLDGDGDMDLVAGNLGLNSLLKASPEAPVELIVNDFDRNGTPDPLLCVYRDGTSYPVATLDELIRQIPGLRDRYPAYRDFGARTAAEIFGEENLKEALYRKAVKFESCLILNNGDGTFHTRNLPQEAQFSTVRDILVSDLDSDSLPDLVVAGNSHAPRPSIGRYDASYGWCLLGSGQNRFVPLMPHESGLIIRGDTRKLEYLNVQDTAWLIVLNNSGEMNLFRRAIIGPPHPERQ